MATTYLNDTADSWYQGWLQTRAVEVSWAEFAEDMCERFGENSMIDVIEEFNKLRQERSVVDYEIQFES